MRTAALIATAAAAFTLSACNQPAEDKTGATTEAAEASGAAADTAATNAEGSTGGSAGAATGGSAGGSASGSRSSTGGQTMAPSGSATVNDGAMAPAAQPPAGAGTTVTETERRLNPPQNNQPAQ